MNCPRFNLSYMKTVGTISFLPHLTRIDIYEHCAELVGLDDNENHLPSMKIYIEQKERFIRSFR